LYKHFKEFDVEKDDTLNEFDSMSCNIFGGMSLDQPIENTDMKLEDTISDPSNVESEFIMSETINNALKKLTPVQRKVIEGIYGFENGEKKTVREIAYELDTSHENVRNIRNKALRILEKLNSKGLL
jgi:RNA polymerase primary sigma factor